MEIRFTKMQGCGNDYVYIDGASCGLTQEEKPGFVRFASDRHFGVGGDGVIFINPSSEADFEMEMYNADGSRSEMCGNGIRCVAKYVHDKGMTDRDRFSIISGGQIKWMELTVEGKETGAVRVDMGEPALHPEKIPGQGAGARAGGHGVATRKLETGCGLCICNRGTGRGYSVLEVLHACEKACGHELPYVIDPRRPGDIAECYADPSKAKRELDWVAEYGIEDMCADSWNWQKNNPDGYHTVK